MGETICTACGNIFYDCEARHTIEVISTHVGLIRNSKMVCPACGSDDLEPARYCEICGGAFLDGDLVGGYVCLDCLKEAMTKDNLDEFMKDDLVKESFAEFLHEKRRK